MASYLQQSSIECLHLDLIRLVKYDYATTPQPASPSYYALLLLRLGAATMFLRLAYEAMFLVRFKTSLKLAASTSLTYVFCLAEYSYCLLHCYQHVIKAGCLRISWVPTSIAAVEFVLKIDWRSLLFNPSSLYFSTGQLMTISCGKSKDHLAFIIVSWNDLSKTGKSLQL